MEIKQFNVIDLWTKEKTSNPLDVLTKEKTFNLPNGWIPFAALAPSPYPFDTINTIIWAYKEKE